MIVRSILLAFLVIFIHFNQPILAEDDPLTYFEPKCNRTKPRYTEEETRDACRLELFRLKDIGKCVEIMKKEVVVTKVCCAGLKATDDDRCVVDCEQKCKHGQCNDNRCKSCAIGFGGDWCDTPCPAGNFGPVCEHNCEW